MTRAGLAIAILVAGALAVPGRARAGEPENKAAAQVLFEAGRALALAKQFPEACPKFAESLRLDRGIGTMLWLADCYENNGQTASAWAQFKEAAAAALLQKDAREHVARRRAAALDPKLSRLELAPPSEGSVPGLEVRRDGVLVGAAELGIPVPVDPGIHTIAAGAPGRKPWSSSVEVPAHAGLLSVTVPVLEPSDPAESTATQPVVPAGHDEAPRASASAGGTRRVIGLSVAGAGLIGIGIGSYLGLDARSSYQGVSGQCPSNMCAPAAKQTRQGAIREATGSTVAFGVGAALVAAGAIVYLTAPRMPAHVALVPAVGPHEAGVSLTRAW